MYIEATMILFTDTPLHVVHYGSTHPVGPCVWVQGECGGDAQALNSSMHNSVDPLLYVCVRWMQINLLMNLIDLFLS